MNVNRFHTCCLPTTRIKLASPGSRSQSLMIALRNSFTCVSLLLTMQTCCNPARVLAYNRSASALHKHQHQHRQVSTMALRYPKTIEVPAKSKTSVQGVVSHFRCSAPAGAPGCHAYTDASRSEEHKLHAIAIIKVMKPPKIQCKHNIQSNLMKRVGWSGLSFPCRGMVVLLQERCSLTALNASVSPIPPQVIMLHGLGDSGKGFGGSASSVTSTKASVHEVHPHTHMCV